MYKKTRILITCKTYPLLSTKYRETVCTGGVLDSGELIRLYPIDFRYRPYWQWYSKYQWIEVEIEKNTKDIRSESYRPKVDSIKNLGEPLGYANNWADRRKVVLKGGIKVMCDLEHISRLQCSLAIVKPRQILDVVYRAVNPEWSARQRAAMQQANLFGPESKPLEKIPYKFYIHFKCEHPDCRLHKKSIEDWEIGVLFRKLRVKYDNPETAAQGVCDKLRNDVLGPRKDTHLFVGTESRHQSWLIVGTFCPPASGGNTAGQIRLPLR